MIIWCDCTNIKALFLLIKRLDTIYDYAYIDHHLCFEYHPSGLLPRRNMARSLGATDVVSVAKSCHPHNTSLKRAVLSLWIHFSQKMQSPWLILVSSPLHRYLLKEKMSDRKLNQLSLHGAALRFWFLHTWKFSMKIYNF